MMWAAIIHDDLIEPCRVANGLKIDSKNYCQFLEEIFFKQWHKKKFAVDYDIYAGKCFTVSSKYSTD